MQLVPRWSGLFQAAFKHQVIVQGVADAHYMRRADIQLPIPPIDTIDVPTELVPNLRDIVGIDADGTIRTMGPTAREDVLPDGRRILTIAGLEFSEDEDDDGLIDHELGTFILGNTALAPDGRVLTVSNAPSFALFAADGTRTLTHRELRDGLVAWEAPATGQPFWVTGAGDIAANEAGFLVGGDPLQRLDFYTWDGRLALSCSQFTLDGIAYDFATENVANVAIDAAGRLLAASARRLFIFAPDGAPVAVCEAEGADFHLWIGCAKDGTLWSQSYRGKEVAYTAYALPGAAGG